MAHGDVINVTEMFRARSRPTAQALKKSKLITQGLGILIVLWTMKYRPSLLLKLACKE